MRAADDQVDGAGTFEDKARRLELFARSTQQLIAGADLETNEQNPVWVAFRATVDTYSINHDDLHALMDGLRLDLQHEREASASAPNKPAVICQARDDLEQYCYSVASTVGLICIAIWGLRGDVDRAHARTLAVQRGLAFQLTNILRDFAEDYDSGRIYLPNDDFSAAELTPADLRNWSDPGRCAGIISSVARWARESYDQSQPLDDMILPDCRPALRAMTRIYSGLLGVIEHEPKRIVGARRIRLQSYHKAGIAITSLVSAWLDGRTAKRQNDPHFVGAHAPATRTTK